jgi:hypothetical protein
MLNFLKELEKPIEETLIGQALGAARGLVEGQTYTFDLGIARDYESVEAFRETTRLTVTQITGTAYMKLNSPSSTPHDLQKVQSFVEPDGIKRIYIYNTAQSGKILVLKSGLLEKSVVEMEADIASILDSQGKIYKLTASDTLQMSSDSEEMNNGSTPKKLKQFTILCSGTLRVYYEIKAESPYSTFIEVMLNGIGIEQTANTTSTTYTPKTHDIMISEGDLVQIWVWSSGPAANSFIQNARIKCDQALAIPPIGAVSG